MARHSNQHLPDCPVIALSAFRSYILVEQLKRASFLLLRSASRRRRGCCRCRCFCHAAAAAAAAAALQPLRQDLKKNEGKKRMWKKEEKEKKKKKKIHNIEEKILGICSERASKETEKEWRERMRWIERKSLSNIIPNTVASQYYTSIW